MKFVAVFRQHKEHNTQHIQLKLVSTRIKIIDSVLILFIYSYKHRRTPTVIRVYIHNNIALENLLVYKYGME